MKILSAISIILFTFQAIAGSYYCNGATKQSGSDWYYPNGATAQSGSSVYYENGSSMGSCPATVRVRAGLDDNDLEVVLDLNSGERTNMSYSFMSSGQPGYVSLSGNGTVNDILYECSNTRDSEVNDLLKSYQSMSMDQKSKVRINICR